MMNRQKLFQQFCERSVVVVSLLMAFSVIFSLSGCGTLAASWFKNGTQLAETKMMPQPQAPQVITKRCPADKISHSCYEGYGNGKINFPSTIEPSIENPEVMFWQSFKTEMDSLVKLNGDVPLTMQDWETAWEKFYKKISVRMDVYEKLYIRETCVDGIVQSQWNAFDECPVSGSN